ncbi:MAG: glycosyltransferase [Bacillota bacterium]
MQGIRVLHVIGGGEFGGAERHILTLFKSVNPQDALIEAACFFTAPFASLAREAGMRVTVLPMYSKLDLGVARRLKEILTGYDIVHTHGVRANLLGRLAARGTGLPVCTTVHSFLSLDYPHPVTRIVNTLSERLTRRFTTRFIAVSDVLAADLEKKGVPRDKISVVYNGICLDVDQGKPDRGLRARLGLPEGIPLIATVGRLHRVKGHRYFVAAAAEVLKQYPQARFLIIGSGPERPELERQIKTLGLEGRVMLTGFVKEVMHYYPEFTALILPSLAEGFGLVVLEAFLHMTPVVATRVGGLIEVVRDGETGFLVPPADAGALAEAVCRVIADPVAAKEMAARGRDFVKREFSAARMAAETVAVYRDLLGSSPRGPEACSSASMKM